MHFTVEDSGIGIHAKYLESIFEAFQQVDGTTSRQYGGTGLGLSISRSLATLPGGTTSASSTPGVGSAFSLTVPLRAGDVVAAEPAGMLDLEPRPALPQMSVTSVTPGPDNDAPANASDGYLIEDDRDLAPAGERLARGKWNSTTRRGVLIT